LIVVVFSDFSLFCIVVYVAFTVETDPGWGLYSERKGPQSPSNQSNCKSCTGSCYWLLHLALHPMNAFILKNGGGGITTVARYNEPIY